MLGESIAGKLGDWLKEGKINNALLFSLNDLMEMAEREFSFLEQLRPGKGKKGGLSIEAMASTKWRSFLYYTGDRNIREKDGEARLKMVGEMAKWLSDHKAAMRIPVWTILYNNR